MCLRVTQSLSICIGSLSPTLLYCVSFILQSGRIGADEAIEDNDGKTTEEMDEILKEKEAKTQAILLEMVRQKDFFRYLKTEGYLLDSAIKMLFYDDWIYMCSLLS